MALTPGTRLGGYDITAQIGEGGMGQAYRATDTRLKRHLAVRILPPSLAADAERLARFQREAEVLASLNHPRLRTRAGEPEQQMMRPVVRALLALLLGVARCAVLLTARHSGAIGWAR